MSPPTPASSATPRARPTIADVAAEAGVSKATVSRYFNHRERLLSPDIAARVEAAIAKLAYVPSPMAQALSHGRSRLIGLVVADITNPYSVAVLRGAEKACQDAGYLVMLFNLGNDRERERAAIDALASYQVDGFILNTLGQGEGQADVNTLHGKPAVLVDRRHAGLAADFVSLDNQGAMREACAHLQQQGWQRLLYITQPLLGVSSRIERTEAFRALVSSRARRCAARCWSWRPSRVTKCWTRHSPICCGRPGPASAARWWRAIRWSRCGWQRPSRAWGGRLGNSWVS